MLHPQFCSKTLWLNGVFHPFSTHTGDMAWIWFCNTDIAVWYSGKDSYLHWEEVFFLCVTYHIVSSQMLVRMSYFCCPWLKVDVAAYPKSCKLAFILFYVALCQDLCWCVLTCIGLLLFPGYFTHICWYHHTWLLLHLSVPWSQKLSRCFFHKCCNVVICVCGCRDIL